MTKSESIQPQPISLNPESPNTLQTDGSKPLRKPENRTGNTHVTCKSPSPKLTEFAAASEPGVCHVAVAGAPHLCFAVYLRSLGLLGFLGLKSLNPKPLNPKVHGLGLGLLSLGTVGSWSFGDQSWGLTA